MKPEHYREFAEFFDFFSNPWLYPQNQEFVDRLSDTLPKKGSVVDVGGGTGAYTEELLSMRPDLIMTFIEPSSEMMGIARERLDAPHVLLPTTLEEALPGLAPHDAFIFSRSLYALYGDRERYRELFPQLGAKLRPRGYLCIWEFNQKYDIDAQRIYLEANMSDSPEDLRLFHERWPLLRQTLEIFNDGVDSGLFTLFGEGELDDILRNAGFVEEYSAPNVFIYRLPKKKGWLRRS